MVVEVTEVMQGSQIQPALQAKGLHGQHHAGRMPLSHCHSRTSVWQVAPRRCQEVCGRVRGGRHGQV